MKAKWRLKRLRSRHPRRTCRHKPQGRRHRKNALSASSPRPKDSSWCCPAARHLVAGRLGHLDQRRSRQLSSDVPGKFQHHSRGKLRHHSRHHSCASSGRRRLGRGHPTPRRAATPRRGAMRAWPGSECRSPCRQRRRQSRPWGNAIPSGADWMKWLARFTRG